MDPLQSPTPPRVRLKVSCGVEGCHGEHVGSQWIPYVPEKTRSHNKAVDFQRALELDLTADKMPEACIADLSDPVMVAWDDRPGALQAHHRDELEFL